MQKDLTIMSKPFKEFAEIDRMIHEPARLAVLTALAACESADFLYLQRLTGLSKGNLSSHLTKLEGAGFVQIDKHFVGKTPRTNARLTAEGRTAITQYWQQVDMLREASLRLAPDT
jgi:DNA-binding MarR family transcriptional regulator